MAEGHREAARSVLEGCEHGGSLVRSGTAGFTLAGRLGAAQGLAGEVEAVGVVDEAVEDGVGVGGVADEGVPVGDGELAGDEGGSSAVAIFEDFQQIVAGLGVERLEAPVVEDEQLDGAEGLEAARRSCRRRGRGPVRRTAWARGRRGRSGCRGRPCGRARRPASSCPRRSAR